MGQIVQRRVSDLMKLAKTTTPVREPPPCGLYRFVFLSSSSFLITMVLLCSFFLQTVEKTFAMTDFTATPSPLAPLITDAVLANIDSVNEPTSLPTTITHNETTINNNLINEESSEELVQTTYDSVPLELEVDNEPKTATPDLPVGEPSTEISDPSATTSSAVVPADDIGGTSTPASSTTSTTTESPMPTLTVESDTMIQFSKDSCIAVENGSFYCQIATTTVDTPDYGLVSLPDQDGDLEIYLKRAQDLTQLTFNVVDDASPYYDEQSSSIVWHRFIDDRYQIMTYDIETHEERQLTDTTTNNMEPFRAGNIIVWQHWANSAWQIMLYDGENITSLTDTVEHNLAPAVHNGLVVWHRVTNGEKTIEVYDLKTGTFTTIRDDDGGTVGNPRMVLVYDSLQSSGETVTRGYDLITGEITSFASVPREIPDEIPVPDPLEEERALVGVKSTEEQSSKATVLPADDVSGSSNSEIIPPLVIATTTDVFTPLTLDLSATTSVIAGPIVSEPSAMDLIIPAFVSTTTPGDVATE